MPTKTEYREYIASEAWQQRRKRFLIDHGFACERCEVPRWLAVVGYDQDLHVHHKNYAHVGAELDEDLEALCRRCHEIETFGRSNLDEMDSYSCSKCKRKTFLTAQNGVLLLARAIGGDIEQHTSKVVQYLERLEMLVLPAPRPRKPGLDDSIAATASSAGENKGQNPA